MQEYTFDTVIVGTGCAGYNCADWLYTLGRRDLAIVTRGRLSGASRNTGSDKQTYYKPPACRTACEKWQGISARAVASTQASRSRKRQAAHAAL